MTRTMMNTKIRRVRVTESNLDCAGSTIIDSDILEAADVLLNEKVAVVGDNNGARFRTHVIVGERGSDEICLNGAVSRLVGVGDVVIIVTYAQLNEGEIKNHAPKVAAVDEDNTIIEVIHEKENTTVL